MKYLVVILSLLLIGCKQQSTLTTINLVEVESESVLYPDGFIYESISIGNNHILTWSRNSHYVDVYDFDLNLTRTVGRFGSGPGEFQRIDDTYWVGDYIIVYDANKKMYEFFDPEGNYLRSVISDKRITSSIVKNDTTIFVNVLEPSAAYVVELSGENLENERYLFVNNNGDMMSNYNILDMDDTHIIVKSMFTNKAFLIDKNNLSVRTLTNRFMSANPSFNIVADVRVPTSTIWRDGLKIDDIFLKARNREGSVSEIFRYQSNGSVDAKFDFPEFITRMFRIDQEIWIFTPTSLQKFPINIFTQEYHDNS